MTLKHVTKTLCDSCQESRSYDRQTTALEEIDLHILHTGHRRMFYLTPKGWLLFGGIG